MRFERELAPQTSAALYLAGVVVTKEARRHGLGPALTRERLRFIASPGETAVCYVVSALHRSSIDLHTALGLEEATRDFHAPGITFNGGHGILFRKAFDGVPAP